MTATPTLTTFVDALLCLVDLLEARMEKNKTQIMPPRQVQYLRKLIPKFDVMNRKHRSSCATALRRLRRTPRKPIKEEDLGDFKVIRVCIDEMDKALTRAVTQVWRRAELLKLTLWRKRDNVNDWIRELSPKPKNTFRVVLGRSAAR